MKLALVKENVSTVLTKYNHVLFVITIHIGDTNLESDSSLTSVHILFDKDVSIGEALGVLCKSIGTEEKRDSQDTDKQGSHGLYL